MVYFRTASEINSAFHGMVGRYNLSDVANAPDSDLALNLANLRAGESVLELGTAGGRLIAKAKLRVGAGVCVGVDAHQGLLNVDFPHTLLQHGLTVFPAGSTTQQIHKAHLNVTDNDFVTTLQALQGAPQRYDCIFALHILTTIPADLRLQTLRNMRRLLSPTGRIITNMSARFTSAPPDSAESGVPVQFLTNPHGYTEAPGCAMLLDGSDSTPVQPAQGPLVRPKVVIWANQVSPDRFWVIARQQAAHAAERAGLSLTASRDIGKGDSFNLPPGSRSPPQSVLEGLPENTIRATVAANVGAALAYHCTGRAHNVLAERTAVHKGQQDVDMHLIRSLQESDRKEKEKIQARGIPTLAMESSQVGCLAVLRSE